MTCLLFPHWSAGQGRVCGVAGSRFTGAHRFLLVWDGKAGAIWWPVAIPSIISLPRCISFTFQVHHAQCQPPGEANSEQVVCKYWGSAALFCGPACWPLLSKDRAREQVKFTVINLMVDSESLGRVACCQPFTDVNHTVVWLNSLISPATKKKNLICFA